MQATDPQLLPPNLSARLDRLSLVTRKRLAGAGQGDRRSRQRGASLEFVDHRPYSPGDDPAKLDWNVYGRSGQLQMKVFEAEEMLSVAIVLDASASMRWGQPDKFRRAQQIAAALGYLGLVGGSRVSLSVLRSRGPAHSRPFWGRRQAAELLRFVAAQATDEPERTPTEAESLEQMVRVSQRSAAGARAVSGAQLVVLISDLLADNWRSALHLLGQPASELVVLQVLDGAEVEPALGGDLNLIDQETGSRVAVTLNAEVVTWYRDHVQTWLGEVTEFCARRGARYARHLTSEPLEQWMFRDLRTRGILR